MDVETEISFLSSSSSQNGFTTACCAKRQRTEERDEQEVMNLSRDDFDRPNKNGSLFHKRTNMPTNYWMSTSHSPKNFLLISANGLVYESEDFLPKGETLYKPLKEEVIINTRNIEQFTFTNGSFFIGDESSRFNRTVQGVSLNMWRFDNQAKKLYISRSFVFTNLQEAQNIKRILESM